MSSSGESDVDDFSDSEPCNSALDPFSESGYKEIIQGSFDSVPRVSFDNRNGQIQEHNPFNLNSNASYSWRQRISKTMVDRLRDHELVPALSTHRDVLYFKENPNQSHDDVLQLLALHILNYLLNIRETIIKNNLKVAKNEQEEARDQGFTRPRFLVLLPFKNTAFKLVSNMIKIWSGQSSEKENQVEQKSRFTDEFGRCIDSDGEEVEEDLSGRPLDFQHNFAGNIDDCFRIGIKMTRKSLKLYSDFYSSDILIASPLGLKLVMDGQDGFKANKKSDKKSGNTKKRRVQSQDHDFLSSIESVIVDQCDIIAMQNWEHLQEIFEKLNCLPKDTHGCDFSRVMSVFLDNRARNCRQSVFLSAFAFPELLSLFNTHCKNVFGAIKMEQDYMNPVMKLSNLKPEFHSLPSASSPLEEAEIRFKYFIENAFSLVKGASHVVIFVSNYFEFLRLKEFLISSEIEFAGICEYTDQKQVTRARSRFFNGHIPLLLVTERFHFFHRFMVKGVKRLLFYSLPAYPQHFAEWIGMVNVKTKVKPYILCSQFDALKMERIFGKKAMQKIHF